MTGVDKIHVYTFSLYCLFKFQTPKIVRYIKKIPVHDLIAKVSEVAYVHLSCEDFFLIILMI